MWTARRLPDSALVPLGAGLTVSSAVPVSSARGRNFHLVRILATVLCIAVGTAGFWFVSKYSLREFPSIRNTSIPISGIEAGRVVIRAPRNQLVGELARYDDELFAYLMFDYLRGRAEFRNSELLLTYSLSNGSITYPIKVILPNEVVRGVRQLYASAADYRFLTPHWTVADDRALHQQRLQTQIFLSGYHHPAHQDLEELSQRDIVEYTRRFIRFKSTTDPRVRRQIEPVPHALTQQEAQALAEDIVSVSQFFSLPLDFFLGIGAMENNYMNVRGDLGHAVWKRAPEKGDVILRRRGKRVLVLNESEGVWQITRETLRYAHRLFLRDKRDYSKLPEHLRPRAEFDAGAVDPMVLTTYAGLLFRDLLDRFEGDAGTAVGAYNGGPGNPNPSYEAGVTLVAQYARRMMGQAAALRGRRVIDLHLPAPQR